MVAPKPDGPGKGPGRASSPPRPRATRASVKWWAGWRMSGIIGQALRRSRLGSFLAKVPRGGFAAAGSAPRLTTMEDSAVTNDECDTWIPTAKDLERGVRRIVVRYDLLRNALFLALWLWTWNSYPVLPYLDTRSWYGIWFLALVGCWKVSGCLLDAPALIFPEVGVFQHLRRPAPRR